MKTVIIYQSLLGTTKKYAHWLEEKTGASLWSIKQIGGKALCDYDQIVVMSGTYAGQMPLIKFLTNNWEFIKDRKIIAIAVGAAPKEDEQSIKSYNLIPKYIREKISYHKIPGKLFGINKEKILAQNLDPIIKEMKQ